jgi:hypothetical protein
VAGLTPKKSDGKWMYRVQGDTSLVVLIGGVVRDLDWTIEVLVKKNRTNQKHTDRFSGLFKKTPIFPSQSVCEKLP